MQVSFNQVKAITDTLPIGLYAGRRIYTELKDKEECSYYDPEQDTIVISYEQLTEGFNNLSDTADIEMLVRSNFYHEISHAILTPKSMLMNDVVNIFEDERIETLLNHFYYGTDFKKCVKAIANYDPNHIPQDSIGAWFYLVRFRQCNDPYFLRRVKEIIEQYSNLKRTTIFYRSYYCEVIQLYQEFCQQCKEKGMSMIMQPNSQGSNSGEKEQIDSGTMGENKGCGKGEKGEESPLTKEQVQQLLSDSLNEEFNNDFHNALSLLFENYRKKNSKGSCLNGYSGVLNPRQADRADYRIFERSSSSRGNNQFGTFHLNLFVDVSGSFQDNQKETNALIKSLILIEKSNPNFTFDVITTNTQSTILPKGHRFIECGGGTYLGKQIEDIYRKLQKPQTYNYNIILFDGDAYCSCTISNNRYSTQGMGFRTFANNNCTIISDIDNKVYIDKYAPTTKTIYTDNYCAELLDNILKVMQRALS